ncbi:histidine kinase N-terminal 7TM domain-containing protein [Maribellus maritimus]|uniref:histidine kinase N-terminal 7TM domain-containing protein n=1 Tax=Maribellus maritimus TaxID=2870838 RepID=UPI001EEBA994|nr:histidine kinase N-terminal 7TM domain-containing protein [Maribellus maritimus]MCG6187543.1 PAS domain-containing protein [Maribellus maritimus]
MTAVAAVIAIIFLWEKRKSQEVKYIILLEILVAVWAITYAFEFATYDLQTKIMWSKLSYFGIAFLPVLYFLFTTAFSQKTKIITKRNIFLLSIIPAITIGLILTNDTHKLVWTDVTQDPILNVAHYHHGVWFWIYWGYAMLLFVSGLYNLVYSIYKFTAYYKSQITVLLLASVIPILGNLMYVTGINPFPGFDWTPVSFVLTGLIIAFGIARYKMFDLVPFARNKLIDTMDDGAIVVNPDGYIEDCNSSVYKIFSLNKTSIINKSFKDIFFDYKTLSLALYSKGVERVQVEIDKRYYQVQISPIYYRKRDYSGSLLLLHDITSIKHAEDELKEANKKLMAEIEIREKLIEDLDSFAHTVAHDLKNTLGTIVASSEILEESVNIKDTKHSARLASLIKNSADKSMRITQELLILARSSRTDIEKSSLDMKTIFAEATEQLNELIQKEKAEIKFPSKWLTSSGYAPWVEEVWVNYLSNAIKYGGHPPKIEVGSELTEENMVKYWIKDNGKGLTEEEQSQLFHKYVRLSSGSIDGQGLGLSIVKRIIDKLGGNVGVEPAKNFNEGSVFYFTLPAI